MRVINVLRNGYIGTVYNCILYFTIAVTYKSVHACVPEMTDTCAALPNSWTRF